ncbi:MAG: glycosyltransferase [Lachnospiraceae bacterium]|nr:glycosyltransferase [Lachnospiraceae bacterium]
MEKISVIIPIYNVEAYLEKCVTSVRCQSYQNLEIILVDDGSPDHCGAFCDRYAGEDSRIKVLHKENGGLSDARNKGLDIATGEYILFVDSDDFIHPEMIEILYHNLQAAEADISVCGFLSVEEGEEVSLALPGDSKTEVFGGEEVMHCLQHRNLLTVVAWNKLYKRSLFAELRYPKGKLHEDEFLIHHLLHQCKRIVYTDGKLYYYLQRSGSIMGALKWNSVADGWQAYEERLAFLQDHGYEQMVVWTKLHMLHYICKFYAKLEQNREADKLLLIWRKQFAALYEELLAAGAMSKEQKQFYKYFVISPQLYYNKKARTKKRVKRRNTLKRIIVFFLLAAVAVTGMLYIRRPVTKTAHISIDDATLIFQDIYLEEYESIFNNPIMGRLKELHDQYEIRVTLYVYYRVGGFSLWDMPLDYRSEFEENADWLKIGFHSDTEVFTELQEASLEDFIEAYTQVQDAIEEFAGENSLTGVLRLHYWYATEDMVKYLHTQGVEGLLCCDRGEPSYDLTEEETEQLYASRDGILEKNEVTYYATDIRLESTENVGTVLEEHKKDRIIVLFTHAWCFMENGDKLEEVVSALYESGYSFDWLESEEE